MSLINNVPFNSVQNFQGSPEQVFHQARQNPVAFENFIRQTNPEGYNQALRIRNSPNPKSLILEQAKMKGINPSLINLISKM